MVELHECALLASQATGRDESALPAVAPPGHALGLNRYVSRGGLIRPGTDRTRSRGQPELLFLDSLEEQRDGPVEDRAGITARNLAAEKRLQALELLVALLADRELDAIAVRRRRLDDGAPWCLGATEPGSGMELLEPLRPRVTPERRELPSTKAPAPLWEACEPSKARPAGVPARR